ncbi:HET-domain-containing protein [Dendrothele bispora CBS 962.96]|uniref:HET-domain-containing protein n=1 Tax=Dendrothele bispora (strain CBS 962.96) TaxID=1314807 RepID=A0A4S8LPV6_DENBC|nr:HET-domain-containing protein [Dendrothele bispora CBS 962.96]
MRLLNTKSFQLEEFHADIPPYAILSHTWEKEEVSFQDIQDLNVAKGKKGWKKVQSACAYARRYKFDWIWIDTCCIDKSSSAELSEAINSMYPYYRGARVCYAYLCDASSEEDPRDVRSGFKRSRWFERGWTLQELIAPRYVVILDKDWKEIGTRWSLGDAISAITSIPVQVFKHGDIEKFSIAQKMSWAASRKTTRPEDMAYCLMGIFGVNMSPIYGEGGEKAFMRLQQEIIKYSDDRSIFAWITSPQSRHPQETRGLLAKSPREFRVSGEVGISESGIVGDKSSFSFGNNGLHIHLPLVKAIGLGDDVFLAPLHCRTNDGRYVGLYLQRTNGNRCVRFLPDRLTFVDPDTPPNGTDYSLTELVVKESLFSRRHEEELPEHDQVIKFHIKLPAQQITFVRGRRDNPVLDWDFNHDCDLNTTTVRISPMGFGEVTSAGLEYQTQTGEEFLITLQVQRGNFPEIHMQNRDTGWLGYRSPQITVRRKPFYVDRILLPFVDTNAMLSCALQMTGDPLENILELDYIPKNDPRIICMTRVLRPPVIGFMVYRKLFRFRSPLFFQEIFPPDFLTKTDSLSCYVSIPDFDGTPNSMHRVIACKIPDLYKDRVIYVALGLHESGMPWTDIIAPSNGHLQTEEVWRSYLDSGSRAKKRQRCQTSASAALNYLWDSLNVTATIEERTTLQLGSHFLKLEVCSTKQRSLSAP